MFGADRSLQWCFLFDNISLHSRDIRNQVTKSRFWRFCAQLFEEQAPNFWPNFINLGHPRTHSKVCWQSTERSRRWGGEKRKKKIKMPAAKHNGCLSQHRRWAAVTNDKSIKMSGYTRHTMMNPPSICPTSIAGFRLFPTSITMSTFGI